MLTMKNGWELPKGTGCSEQERCDRDYRVLRVSEWAQKMMRRPCLGKRAEEESSWR